METVRIAIEGVPPVWTEREDVGEQLAKAILDLAEAPKGGVFSCKWLPKEHAVYWSYQWLQRNGCRVALIGQVMTHQKHIPCREVQVENQDRYCGLPESQARYAERINMGWTSDVYPIAEYECWARRE